MAVDKKVSITLKGRDLASKALGKVRNTINRIKSAVFSLQGAFVALGAIIIGKFAKTFITAFIKQQDAVESLKASLIATGKEGEASLRRLTASAAELQKVTKAGDEATIQATASLALLARLSMLRRSSGRRKPSSESPMFSLRATWKRRRSKSVRRLAVRRTPSVATASKSTWPGMPTSG